MTKLLNTNKLRNAFLMLSYLISRVFRPATISADKAGRPSPRFVVSKGSCKGSVAFEYVIVTIFGVGLSLLIMSTAKTMIKGQLEAFKKTMEQNLRIQGEEYNDDEPW